MLTLNGYELNCNCADFQHKIARNVDASNLSELVDRNWTNSQAAAQQLLCKHLWNAIVYEKLLDDFPIPTDLPTLPVAKRKTTQSYKLQKNKKLGDDFSYVSRQSASSPWVI